MSEWVEPKTDWTKNDRFNLEDYNRIKNNLVFLNERASRLVKPFSHIWNGSGYNQLCRVLGRRCF